MIAGAHAHPLTAKPSNTPVNNIRLTNIFDSLKKPRFTKTRKTTLLFQITKYPGDQNMSNPKIPPLYN
jgi:hypothetical protein